MYHKIIRNMDLKKDASQEAQVTAAALLHDVGHGPFSHTMEEILEEFDVQFDHEGMTQRIITEKESEVYTTLTGYDPKLPELLVPFFDKTKRTDDSWHYKVVSSQLDGDRLDYLLRDSFFAGVRGPGFDLQRLLDLLHCHEGKRIAVERGGLEAVEAYLVTLDQMYRNVYYHHTVRAASVVLTSAIKRAVQLDREMGDKNLFPNTSGGSDNPLKRLISEGSNIPLEIYGRLNESSLWGLIDGWRDHKDQILSDLSNRLYTRKLFKTLPLEERPKKTMALVEAAKSETRKVLPFLDDETVNYYVAIDEPTRTAYKRYNWSAESPDESIWLVGGASDPCPIEDETGSYILDGLRKQRHFSRLVVHESVRTALEG
jgi:HD superfamily phosphohydrolase